MVELADLLLGRFHQQADSADDALALAESIASLTQHKDPRVLWTLVSALEAAGKAHAALETAQKALPLERKAKKDNLFMALHRKIKILKATPQT